MKRALFIFLLLASKVSAQQDPLYSQYINNMLLINPAYAGASTDFNASVMYRKQWAGFEGSPATANASAHMALAGNKVGFGFMVLTDKVGTDNTTNATMSYAYHISFKKDLKLSFGLQAGFVNYKTDYSKLTIDPKDPQFANVNEWNFNTGTGAILRSEKFMVSISVPRFLKNSYESAQGSVNLYTQHAYALGAYAFPLSSRITIKPWILARIVKGAPLSLDYAASMRIDDSYALGVITRNFTTIGAFAQINLGDNLRFAYVYEVPFKNATGINNSTHEFTAGLRLKVFRFHDVMAVRNF